MQGVRIRLTRIGVLLTLAGAAASLAAPAAALGQAPAGGPALLWSAPVSVTHSPIDAVACPTASLCFAADAAGNIISSADPTAGASSWSLSSVDGVALTGLACPAVTLCVATDQSGSVVTSANPTGGSGAWTTTAVDSAKGQADGGGGTLLRGLACPTTTLCVAIDAAGNAVYSTAPVGGASAWTTTPADTALIHGCSAAGPQCQPALVGVSCPSVNMCVAADFSGNVLITGSPAAATPWAASPTAGGSVSSLWGISCPTTTFCATVDGYADNVITFNPTAIASTVVSTTVPYGVFGIWCANAEECVASATTQDGQSVLLSSTDPTGPSSAWSVTHVGGIGAVACPLPTTCIAGDAEGDITVGATAASIAAGLQTALMPPYGLPSIPTLLNHGGLSLDYTSPIPATLYITWDAPAESLTPTVIATGAATYSGSPPEVVSMQLTSAGRQLLLSTTRLDVLSTATLAASSGSVSAHGQFSGIL